MKNGEAVLVYVSLLEEGSPTLLGTQAIKIKNDTYELLPTPDYDPEDTIWEFLPGSIVRCEMKENYGKKLLVAVEKIS